MNQQGKDHSVVSSYNMPAWCHHASSHYPSRCWPILIFVLIQRLPGRNELKCVRLFPVDKDVGVLCFSYFMITSLYELKTEKKMLIILIGNLGTKSLIFPVALFDGRPNVVSMFFFSNFVFFNLPIVPGYLSSNLHLKYICYAYYIGCGGTFTNCSGVLTSPSYPGNYGHNEDCVYTVTSPIGGLVTLRTVDFRLEGCCDYVRVSDKNFLLTHCGRDKDDAILQTFSNWFSFMENEIHWF